SVCLSSEVAWESDGQGEFTLRATHLLPAHGLGFTNEQFIEALVVAFGLNRRQTPNISCAAAFRSRGLLHPVAGLSSLDRCGASDRCCGCRRALHRRG